MINGNGLGDLLAQVSKVYSDITNRTAPEITLETNITPPISLTGEQSQVTAYITNLIKPTVRLGDTVLYAPAGPANRSLGAWVFWAGLVSLGVAIVFLVRR